MIVKFNTLDRREVPSLFLCNPGCFLDEYGGFNYEKPDMFIGQIPNIEALECVYNFNSVSEINFRTNLIKYDVDDDVNASVENIYNSIKNRRLLFVGDLGFFVISDVVDGIRDGVYYKDVSARSADAEFEQKIIPFIENGTYKFYSSGGEVGLFNMIMGMMPLWDVAEVSGAVAERYRTFNDVDLTKNCLSFLIEEMQEAYECIFVFDTKNRKVSVFDRAEYVKTTSIHLTKDDFLNEIDVTESADDLYTAITVFGGDNDVSVAAVNPLGTSTIYDFSYYLDWMSEGLRNKVVSWSTLVESERANYVSKNLSYYDKLEEVVNLRAEIDRINTYIDLYKRCRDNVVAERGNSTVYSYNSTLERIGATPIGIGNEIAVTVANIDSLIGGYMSQGAAAQASLNTAETQLNTIRGQIDAIVSSVSIVDYFTPTEYRELSNYIFEGEYKDEYIIFTDMMSQSDKFEQMKTLHSRAKDQLSRVSYPVYEFKVDVENFAFVKDFEDWTSELETGSLINIELRDNDVAQLFLSNITINYDDNSLSMTFGSRFSKFDPRSLFDNFLGNITKSANTLGYIKEILNPVARENYNSMREALQTSRNITMLEALSSTGQEVIIDESGYTGRRIVGEEDGEFQYDPQQVKITGKTIVFTDDAWESAKIAIGEILLADGDVKYGVNAEAVIGDLFIGNNLRILDSDGNDAFMVVEGKIMSAISGFSEDINDVSLRVSSIEQTAEGIDFVIKSITTQRPDGTYEVGVDNITTSTGYTFNEEGLRIHKSGEEISNLLDHTGMYVRRSDGTDILTANADGVDAINLTARQFLIIGSRARFEDYSTPADKKRIGCFYIG